jgi:hypothetical protein
MLLFTGEGSIREYTVTLVYFPCDSDEPLPPRELWEVIAHCCRNNVQLIAGCDAYAYHTKCGTPGINPRGHHLLERLVVTNVNIFKNDNELTFGVRNR